MNKTREKFGHRLAAHSFPVLYMWKDELGFTIYVEDDFFVVRQKHGDCYCFPCGAEERKRDFITQFIDDYTKSGKRSELAFMTVADAQWLQSNYPGRFQLWEDRDSFEYLYDLAEQVGLKGDRFKPIRRRINQSIKERDFSYEPLTPANTHRARSVVYEWNQVHSSGGTVDFGDTGPALLALDAWQCLGMTGMIIHDGVRDCGLVLGSPLSPDTYAIHIAKSIFHSGLDHYCRHLFCEMLAQPYIYLNMEDDMGIAGLRKYKTLLLPISLTAVWRGRLHG